MSVIRYFIDPFRGDDPGTAASVKHALRRVGCGDHEGNLVLQCADPFGFSVQGVPDMAVPGGSQSLCVGLEDDPGDAIRAAWEALTAHTDNGRRGALLIYKGSPLFPANTPGGPERYKGYFCCFWNPDTRRFEQAVTHDGLADGVWGIATGGAWMWLPTLPR